MNVKKRLIFGRFLLQSLIPKKWHKFRLNSKQHYSTQLYAAIQFLKAVKKSHTNPHTKIPEQLKRFPSDFMFELTKDEFTNLRSQIVTSSWGGTRYVPMAFTEPGVAMLSSILKSDRAIEVNIQIMRVFIKLRQLLLNNEDLRKEISGLKHNTEERFQVVFETLDRILATEEKPKKKIGFTVKENTFQFSG